MVAIRFSYMTTSMSMIDSPCVKVCTLDARSGLCLGCGRTIDEIARWSAMSASDRRLIMAELAARLETGKTAHPVATIG